MSNVDYALKVGLSVVPFALGVFVIGWIVKQIWTWKEPMSAPAKFMTPPPPRPPSALDQALERIFTSIVGIIFMIGTVIFGLWLLIVLIKFLWVRAPQL